ncbi:hypothetical protein CBR_g48404 [Chara braunii]|uniref:Reverse transcriptase/retrotransposon-derived protein RNase H-like domain-containing protein n=1 Tax=Chara braunii TaxID=69332 RepID=A0A388M2H5_CHABU|nr:hypothetical protein CBR_g48404 [Chara braunii]|eukprot:GBG88788.1 hypothetical protein CBR_g48404 [Chara braunii]
MVRRMTFWADRPRGILPPRISEGRVEISLPARNTIGNPVMDWVGVELVEDTVYLVMELEWRARGEFGDMDLNLPGRVRATGSLHLSEEGWRTFRIALASGDDPIRMFEGAWQITWREGFEFADPERDDVTAEVKVDAAGVLELPNEVVRMSLPPFLLRRMGGIERVEQAVTDVTRLNFNEALMYREYYRAFLEMGPFRDEQGHEVLCILRASMNTRPGVPQISDETMWRFIRREVGRGATYIDDLYRLKPDPAKTDKISQWLTPLRTTTKVRAFLGVVGFWRIFIQNFAKIDEPIRAMIREEGTMDWTEEREGVVQRLKDILTSETVALSAPCFNDEVGRPFILETDGGPLAVGGVLIQRDEEGKERPIRFESRTLNSAERRYSQFKKEVLAILHCLKTFQAYLFGRRFILRIDPTNVAGDLKNYRPIDPTVGRWVGFIWQFDYNIERIAGIRNKADGISRVCTTPEGMEDAEPIDAFLEYEGGTLAVDNEMMSEGCTSGELLIQTLEKGAPTVVTGLREGPVTTRGRREENDSWGAIVGPKEELMAMAVEGGREAVMSLVESSERKELQWVVNQMQEGKDGG